MFNIPLWGFTYYGLGTDVENFFKCAAYPEVHVGYNACDVLSYLKIFFNTRLLKFQLSLHFCFKKNINEDFIYFLIIKKNLK